LRFSTRFSFKSFVQIIVLSYHEELLPLNDSTHEVVLRVGFSLELSHAQNSGIDRTPKFGVSKQRGNI
jgi:hypothetical protein